VKVISAQNYVESSWPDGVHTAWQFSAADGEPWGVAGQWSEWMDPATGEVLPSFTMVTQNCDERPLLQLMHLQDPKRPPHM
jgi:putative SOS response-associated peptidase YedK